jgi:hypothetical protein
MDVRLHVLRFGWYLLQKHRGRNDVRMMITRHSFYLLFSDIVMLWFLWKKRN